MERSVSNKSITQIDGRKNYKNTKDYLDLLNKQGRGKAILFQMINRTNRKLESGWSDWDRGWDRDYRDDWDRNY
jgi:hypothetical protein